MAVAVRFARLCVTSALNWAFVNTFEGAAIPRDRGAAERRPVRFANHKALCSARKVALFRRSLVRLFEYISACVNCTEKNFDLLEGCERVDPVVDMV